MNEPRFQNNHWANILNANYTDVEIGMAQGRMATFTLRKI
jgi:hypothetical protein